MNYQRCSTQTQSDTRLTSWMSWMSWLMVFQSWKLLSYRRSLVFRFGEAKLNQRLRKPSYRLSQKFRKASLWTVLRRLSLIQTPRSPPIACHMTNWSLLRQQAASLISLHPKVLFYPCFLCRTNLIDFFTFHDIRNISVRSFDSIWKVDMFIETICTV